MTNYQAAIACLKEMCPAYLKDNLHLGFLSTTKHIFMLPLLVFKICVLSCKNQMMRGAQYLTGEKLKVVWAEFSTLS